MTAPLSVLFVSNLMDAATLEAPAYANVGAQQSPQESISMPPPPLLVLPLSLVSISLYRPNVRDSQLLVDALKRLVHLRELSLYCVECLNDKTLIQILANNGANLSTLYLVGYMALNVQLTDASIKHISKHCSLLSSLSMEFFSSSCRLDSLQTLFESPTSAAKFEHLNLNACRSLNSNLLTLVALNCAQLRSLHLSGLTQHVNDTLVTLLANTMINLEYLDIKACSSVHDEPLCLLATKCPLKCLVLSGITNLTDKIIFTIANHLQTSLREIYLSGCTKISAVSIRYLSDCCNNKLYVEHRVPNLDPNQLMAKNLDTGFFERVDLINFY
jgi:hypothetical protein